jgi:hypothetical protein
MSQQLGILGMIDIESAIKTCTLEGNIYLMDNGKNDGSTGQGTGNLITAINGTYWIDGTQANEQVLNWLLAGIGSLPTNLPRNFHHLRSRDSVDRLHQNVVETVSKLSLSAKKTTKKTAFNAELTDLNKHIGIPVKIENADGSLRDTELKLLNAGGGLISQFDDQGNLLEKLNEDNLPANYLQPRITDITGEAVEKGVIFQAQYGYPDIAEEGWYWSASVSTYVPGIYTYKMHITIYDLSLENGVAIYRPIEMTYDSHIQITTSPKVNGFTKGTIGYLPIPF